MPFPRANHKSIFHENQFIVFGGQNKGVKFNDLWIFNLEKNRWNEIKTNLLEWPIV